MHFFNSCKEKMLMRGDFDLNSSHTEVLKQTVLSQDIIFRDQVYELHRLYCVQKTLEKDLGKFNSSETWGETSLSSIMQPTELDQLEKQPRSSSIFTVDPICQKLSTRQHGKRPKLQQWPLDLQLPADQYIYHSGESFQSERGPGDSLKETSVLINFLGASHLQDKVDLKLSLSLGVDNRTTEATKRTWFGKRVRSCSQTVIDLEEPTQTIIDLEQPTQDVIDLEEPTQIVIDLEEPTGRLLSTDEVVAFQGCNSPTTWKQQFVSYESRELDLNEVVQLDDPSFHSNDPTVVNSLTACLSGGSNELAGCTQEGFRPTTISSTLTGRTHQKEIFVNLDIVNASSDSKGTEICEDTSSISKNGKDESVSVLIDTVLQGSRHQYVESRQKRLEKSEEEEPRIDQSQNIQELDSDRSPPSCKSCCIADNDSTSVKLLQSGLDSPNSSFHQSDQFSGIQIESQVTKALSGVQDQRSPDTSKSKHEYTQKPDDATQEAAESLIFISAYNQDFSTQAGFGEKDQPQVSYDSFELKTMQLEENNVDDYCVSSKPLNVSNTNTKDFGLKLRRGRRMKDFQKDILPGLASLSRQEIREDVNLMEGILRSREYRKFRGNGASSWSAPVKNKRSRLNTAKRRRYLK